MTVDHFIGGLEDGLLDLALVLKQGRAKCKTFITNEYFNENETRIQQGQNCIGYTFTCCISVQYNTLDYELWFRLSCTRVRPIPRPSSAF